MIYKILAFLAIISLFFSCKKADNTQDLIDDKIIQDYLTSKKISATKTKSGLYYTITKVGAGKQVLENSTVYLKYKGYFSNDSVFDQSKTGMYFNLNEEAIRGFKEGLTYFNVGGSGSIFVPSKLGYGKTTNGSIPSNAVLFFDIEVIEIK